MMIDERNNYNDNNNMTMTMKTMAFTIILLNCKSTKKPATRLSS